MSDSVPSLAIVFSIGFGLGALLVWLIARAKAAAERAELIARKDAERSEALRAIEQPLAEARAQAGRIPELQEALQNRETVLREWQSRHSAAEACLASIRMELAKERDASAEKLALLDAARQTLSDAFLSLSAEALQRNNASFLELARTSLERFHDGAKGDLEKRQVAITELVKPVRDSLERVDAKIQEIERNRTGSYEALSQQVRLMMEAQTQLRTETTNLAQALRSPVVRGRWGEVQLRRVVELSGMLAHCDFTEQVSVSGEGGRLRPDLVVRLPGGKQIVVDAKAPLASYLEAMETNDPEGRRVKLLDHARQIRSHIEALTRKAYWEQFAQSPEFVILFLPGESFFSAALEHDPLLIEYGTDRSVILATPTTLISLLKAVFYGWRQQDLAHNAEEISRLGRELYKRVADMGGYMEKMGRSLNNAVEQFNRLAANTESRVLVTARKFRDIEPAQPGGELEPVTQVESVAGNLQAPEFQSNH